MRSLKCLIFRVRGLFLSWFFCARLYYYGARYYAAWLCRFVSVDPLQFEYPYYTPYQYAGNKPVTFIDLDGLEPAEVKSKTQVYEETKKTVSHIDSILKNLTIKDLGGNPLNRFEAQEMFHKAKTALEKGLFITGNYEKGFKFNSEAWKESYLKEKGLTRADFKGIDHNSKLAQDYKKDLKNAISAADQVIKNSPFFTLFPKETTVYMGNSEDTSIDWGKYGGILDWVGIGIEGVGYVVLWIPGGQFVGGALVGIGKVAGVAGTALEVYNAIEKDKNEDAGVIVVIGVLSSATSVPVNKGIQKGILNNLDRAVIETNKNTTLELTENELTK